MSLSVVSPSEMPSPAKSSSDKPSPDKASPTMAFRSLADADLKGKRVLVRVDLNVPMQDGKVADATRIKEIVPTITEIADKGGKVILLSHFGRPKGPNAKDSLRPVAAEVARILKMPVAFAEDCVGPKAEAAIAVLKNGDILCLENTRFPSRGRKRRPRFCQTACRVGRRLCQRSFFSCAPSARCQHFDRHRL